MGAGLGTAVRCTDLGSTVDRPMWCRRMCVATHLLVLAFGDKVAHWKQLLCALLAHLLHTQCVAPKAAALCFPRGQGMQRAMAFRGWKWPFVHGLQRGAITGAGGCAKVPAASSSAAGVGGGVGGIGLYHICPSAQTLHFVLPSAALDGVICPWGQKVQDLLPCCEEKRPAVHAVHETCSAPPSM